MGPADFSHAGWPSAQAARHGGTEIQISETETPLHQLETVYRRLVEQLCTASYPPSALREIIEAWFYTWKRTFWPKEQLSRGYGALARGVNALLERGWLMSRAPRLPLRRRCGPTVRRRSRGSTPPRTASSPGSAASPTWPPPLAGPPASAEILTTSPHLVSCRDCPILRDSGHPGLLVVLDEIETLQRVHSDRARQGPERAAAADR